MIWKEHNSPALKLTLLANQKQNGAGLGKTCFNRVLCFLYRSDDSIAKMSRFMSPGEDALLVDKGLTNKWRWDG